MSGEVARSDLAVIRDLNRVDYSETLVRQKNYTRQRTETSIDEVWLLEHDPVFSLGQNSKSEHVLAVGDIPLVQSDRGGQVTYHGPGQLVVYLLLDLKRKGLGIRQVIDGMELAVIELLASYGLSAKAKRSAPGVYINDAKICSLGLRVSRSCTYHGLSLNVKMDLEPYSRINPCGFPGLTMVDLCGLGTKVDMTEIKQDLVMLLLRRFGYQHQAPAGWFYGF
jgi:lipoyl(octanoyl) transferase